MAAQALTSINATSPPFSAMMSISPDGARKFRSRTTQPASESQEAARSSPAAPRLLVDPAGFVISPLYRVRAERVLLYLARYPAQLVDLAPPCSTDSEPSRPGPA